MAAFQGSIAHSILDEVLTVIRARRGVDFRGYRRGTLERRLLSRMMRLGARTAESYLATLDQREDETDRLVEQLTVKVSRFFRNARVFDVLGHQVVPDLLARFPRQRLRLWSAGCGQGEEAYSLAMLVAGVPADVCASDLDPAAVDAGRRRSYPARAFAELPEPLRTRYLEPAGHGRFRVSDAIAERVRFVRHDLTAAPGPPDAGGFHLVCCRNVVIYLEPEFQRRTFQVLAHGLVPGGVLCLGEAEWVPDGSLGLAVIDRKAKLFRKVEEADR